MATALQFFFWFTLLIAHLEPATLGARPNFPDLGPQGEDTILFENTSAQVFFAKRAENTVCKEQLRSRRNQIKTIQKKMKYLAELFHEKGPTLLLEWLQSQDSELGGFCAVKTLFSQAKSVDLAQCYSKLESLQQRLYDVFLQHVDICGPCAAREIKTSGSFYNGGVYYESDGSCLLPSALPKEAEEAFTRAKSFLLTPTSYLRGNGGFPHILAFTPYGSEGSLLSVDKLPHTPPLLYIGVLGPNPTGKPMSFSYYVLYDIKQRKNPGTLQDFLFEFYTAKTEEEKKLLPANLVPEPLWLGNDLKLGQYLKPDLLTEVSGFWYVTDGGYLRYSTKARLPLDLNYFKKVARNILLLTLVTFVDTLAGDKAFD